MGIALRLAGFEIRDCGQWARWTGFPKSLDVSKAIDATDPAKRWAGWGTALKPAVEPWYLARRPLEGTVASNVLRWGTGALNIDACRFAPGDPMWPGPQDDEVATHSGRATGEGTGAGSEVYRRLGPKVPGQSSGQRLGRWPANLVHVPGASRAERDAGCDGLPAKPGHDAVSREEGSAGAASPRAGAGRAAEAVKNYHPTVKPVELMRWLVRLVTPPGGVVLDPFMGSGTTGMAAAGQGFRFVGVELDPEHLRIARARIAYAAPGQAIEAPPEATDGIEAPTQAGLW